jgi:hypothetical protein
MQFSIFALTRQLILVGGNFMRLRLRLFGQPERLKIPAGGGQGRGSQGRAGQGHAQKRPGARLSVRARRLPSRPAPQSHRAAAVIPLFPRAQVALATQLHELSVGFRREQQRYLDKLKDIERKSQYKPGGAADKGDEDDDTGFSTSQARPARRPARSPAMATPLPARSSCLEAQRFAAVVPLRCRAPDEDEFDGAVTAAAAGGGKGAGGISGKCARKGRGGGGVRMLPS